MNSISSSAIRLFSSPRYNFKVCLPNSSRDHVKAQVCLPNSSRDHVKAQAHTGIFRRPLRRKLSIYACKSEERSSLQSIIVIDRLIDRLRVANDRELPQDVAENILEFDASFWTRLAARTEQCTSEDDKADFEEFTSSLMTMVDRYVNKTTEKIESATDVLKEILKPITSNEEIIWPPKDPDSLLLIKKAVDSREEEGQLDEGFLSEVNAQLRKAKADDDKPGLVAILRKVLQFYASKTLSRRSYATKGGKVIDKEKLLETIIKAREEEWNKLLFKGLIYGGGSITIEDFNAVVQKRIERIVMRTVNGSYQQRVLGEYLREILTRAQNLDEAFKNQQ